MLPRPVVVGLVILLTLMEAVNLIGTVFLGHGADAFHFVYPTVLAALGFTSKGKVELPPKARAHLRDLLDTDEDADTEEIAPPTSHRKRRKGDDDD